MIRIQLAALLARPKSATAKKNLRFICSAFWGQFSGFVMILFVNYEGNLMLAFFFFSGHFENVFHNIYTKNIIVNINF